MQMQETRYLLCQWCYQPPETQNTNICIGWRIKKQRTTTIRKGLIYMFNVKLPSEQLEERKKNFIRKYDIYVM